MRDSAHGWLLALCLFSSRQYLFYKQRQVLTRLLHDTVRITSCVLCSKNSNALVRCIVWAHTLWILGRALRVLGPSDCKQLACYVIRYGWSLLFVDWGGHLVHVCVCVIQLWDCLRFASSGNTIARSNNKSRHCRVDDGTEQNFLCFIEPWNMLNPSSHIK